jgi:hypothetical protein
MPNSTGLMNDKEKTVKPMVTAMPHEDKKKVQQQGQFLVPPSRANQKGIGKKMPK